MRVGPDDLLRIRQPHLPQQRDGPGQVLRAVPPPDPVIAVGGLDVDHLGADPEDRVERRERVLEDHGDPLPAHAPQRLLGERGQVRGSVEQDPAAGDSAVGREQAQDRQGERALARPRFPDEPKDLAPVEGKIDARQDAGGRTAALVFDSQILDLQSDIARGHARHRDTPLSRGSSTSRSASPNMRKPTVAIASASDANRTAHGAW